MWRWMFQHKEGWTATPACVEKGGKREEGGGVSRGETSVTAFVWNECHIGVGMCAGGAGPGDGVSDQMYFIVQSNMGERRGRGGRGS